MFYLKWIKSGRELIEIFEESSEIDLIIMNYQKDDFSDDEENDRISRHNRDYPNNRKGYKDSFYTAVKQIKSKQKNKYFPVIGFINIKEKNTREAHKNCYDIGIFDIIEEQSPDFSYIPLYFGHIQDIFLTWLYLNKRKDYKESDEVKILIYDEGVFVSNKICKYFDDSKQITSVDNKNDYSKAIANVYDLIFISNKILKTFNEINSNKFISYNIIKDIPIIAIMDKGTIDKGDKDKIKSLTCVYYLEREFKKNDFLNILEKYLSKEKFNDVLINIKNNNLKSKSFG